MDATDVTGIDIARIAASRDNLSFEADDSPQVCGEALGAVPAEWAAAKAGPGAVSLLPRVRVSTTSARDCMSLPSKRAA